MVTPESDNSDLAASLSDVRHDLRTAAGHIIGFAEIIYEDHIDDVPPEMVRDLEAIKVSGERLVGLIDQLLGVGKFSETNLEEAQLRLRLQLSQICSHAEILREQGIEAGQAQLLSGLERISNAAQKLLQLVETRLRAGALEENAEEDPRIPQASPVPARTTDTAAELGDGGRILVVDDDPSNRELIYRRLVRQGYEAICVESGIAALDLVKEERFDLILLDMLMPGMSGLETLGRLKADARLRSIPVIMLTASDSIDTMVHSVLAGAEDYIFKPFNPILLRARIRACLEKVRLRQNLIRRLTIFISSPGDVIPERRIAKRVISQLNEEFIGRVFLVPILWEEEPLLASQTFQEQILQSYESDIYLCILWSRIGSPLSQSFVRPDGTRYDSGTAFEFEKAMAGYRERRRPEILLYRKLGVPVVSLDDRNQVLERLDQMERLNRYVDKWFLNEDGSYIGAFHNFENGDQLESLLETHLRKLVLKQIDEDDTQAKT